MSSLPSPHRASPPASTGAPTPEPANLRGALEAVADRWTLLIVHALLPDQRRHFRDLLRQVDGIASNILSERLRHLSERGLVSKHADPAHKQKAVYQLTPRGAELAPVLEHLAAWGDRLLSDRLLSSR
jgi:DNA-binding HxlR family transcriptional regulator